MKTRIVITTELLNRHILQANRGPEALLGLESRHGRAPPQRERLLVGRLQEVDQLCHLRLRGVARPPAALQRLLGPAEQVVPVLGDGGSICRPIQQQQNLSQVPNHRLVGRRCAGVALAVQFAHLPPGVVQHIQVVLRVGPEGFQLLHEVPPFRGVVEVRAGLGAVLPAGPLAPDVERGATYEQEAQGGPGEASREDREGFPGQSEEGVVGEADLAHVVDGGAPAPVVAVRARVDALSRGMDDEAGTFDTSVGTAAQARGGFGGTSWNRFDGITCAQLLGSCYNGSSALEDF